MGDRKHLFVCFRDDTLKSFMQSQYSSYLDHASADDIVYASLRARPKDFDESFLREAFVRLFVVCRVIVWFMYSFTHNYAKNCTEF